jgi:hypothetical protein
VARPATDSASAGDSTSLGATDCAGAASVLLLASTVGHALFEASGVPRGGTLLLYPGFRIDIRFLSARIFLYHTAFLTASSSGSGTSGVNPVGLTPPTSGVAGVVLCSEKSFAFSFMLCDGVSNPRLSKDFGAVEEVAIEDTEFWAGSDGKEGTRTVVSCWIYCWRISSESDGAGKVVKGGFKGSCLGE